MANERLLRVVANTVRQAPWLMNIARIAYRLRQPKFTAGVVGVVFDPTDRVLLVEHVLHPYNPWGLPGGWVDRHENPAETVRREMQEELELSVEVGPLLLAKIDNDSHLDLAYLCYMNGSIGGLSKELLDYGWYARSQLPDLHTFHHDAIQTAIAIRNST